MNLPKDFIDLVTPILGNDIDNFLEAMNEHPQTSIRINDKLNSALSIINCQLSVLFYDSIMIFQL